MPESMRESNKLQSRGAERNLQKNLPGARTKTTKSYFDPDVLNSGDAEEACLQGSDSLSLSNRFKTFRRKLVPYLLSVKQSKTLEDEGRTILRKAGNHSPNNKLPHH
jgi:hypothetical protein